MSLVVDFILHVKEVINENSKMTKNEQIKFDKFLHIVYFFVFFLSIFFKDHHNTFVFVFIFLEQLLIHFEISCLLFHFSYKLRTFFF